MCETTVFSFLSAIVNPGDSILIAVSGGGDSVALLHLISGLKKRLGISKIGIAHVNHGLRGAESDADEAFVRELTRKLGCGFHKKQLKGLTIKSAGLENEARTARYGFIKALMNKHSYRFAATGHTADDQAETVIMRMMRGTGLTGLTGILPVREDGIIRPMHAIRRQEVRNWLELKGLEFREDSSNKNVKFKRNWVRHTILPVMEKNSPQAVSHLCSIASAAAKILEKIRPQINNWLLRNVLSDNEKSVVISKGGLSQNSLIAGEAIAEIFRRHSVPFTRQHIVSFFKNCERKTGRFLLPGNWMYVPQKDSVLLTCEKKQRRRVKRFSVELVIPGTTECVEQNCVFTAKCGSIKDFDLKFDKSNETVFLDAIAAEKNLVYRSIKPGEIFKPLGSIKPRSVLRFFKTQKKNPQQGVVAKEKGDIVWIPGLAVGHDYRIKKETTKVIKITLRMNPPKQGL